LPYCPERRTHPRPRLEDARQTPRSLPRRRRMERREGQAQVPRAL